ncbi:MAG: hypothetical protein Q8S21_06780 [Candidatus Paracaedibacteraceae bacterium]|nr:hypothetical protein [Candidatus Paracaedibacteraceae bacterium]
MRNVILITIAITAHCFAMDVTTPGFDADMCGIENSRHVLAEPHIEAAPQSLTLEELLEKNNSIKAEISSINVRLLNEDLTERQFLELKKKRAELELSSYQCVDENQLSFSARRRQEDLGMMIWHIDIKLLNINKK